MTKISIIIPMYNTAEYIVRCVDSVLAQKGVELECIIVDDCSTDNSVQIVENYTDTRVKLLRHEHNRGQAAGRNSGFEASSGDWIVYLDSDDSLPENTLRTMLDKATTPEVDWVQGGFNRISPSKEWRTAYTAAHYKSHSEIAESYANVNLSNVAGKLINRRIANHKFTEGVYFEDTLWCQEVYPDLKNIVILDTAVYNHFMREGSTMRSLFTERKAESQIHIIEQIVAMNPDANQEESATYIAMNLIKNLYLGDFSKDYRLEVMNKLKETGVFEMKINRQALPPFTKILSYNFRKQCSLYYSLICGAYKIYKK